MSESVKIIENGFIVACDRERRAGRYALLLKNDRISELNTSAEGFKARFPGAEIIDASEKVILPGFVDPHYHGESFLLQNWTLGMPMTRWTREGRIRRALDFIYRSATKEDLILLYHTAYFAALKSGVTFLSEFCFDRVDTPFLAAREAMKRSDLKGFVGVHNAEQADVARNQTVPPVRYGYVVPEEEALTTYNLQTTLRAVEETRWPMVTHFGETRKGQEASKRNFHRPIIRVLEEYRLFDQPLHLTHLAVLEEEELNILSRLRIPIIVNPSSVLSKQTELPPIPALLDRGIPVAICSDWGSSDPFANLRAFNFLARLTGIEVSDPQALLVMHTSNAARAMGVYDETGSIEPGKRADLAFVDLSDLRLQLPLDVNLDAGLKNLLHRCTADDISDVMINGEFFVRRGEVMTYSEEDLKREYREIVERIVEAAGGPANVGTQDRQPAAAQILPLNQGNESEEGEESRDSFEEGFRVVGKTGSITEGSPRTRSDDQNRKADLPKDVRKVFGDDDY